MGEMETSLCLKTFTPIVGYMYLGRGGAEDALKAFLSTQISRIQYFVASPGQTFD